MASLSLNLAPRGGDGSSPDKTGHSDLRADAPLPSRPRWIEWTAALLLCLGTILPLRAADPLVTGHPAGQILTAGNNRLLVLSPSGDVLWQLPTKLTHDVWKLANGNILFADGATVTEVSPDKKVVFQYVAKEQKGGGTFACQRLANGNTLVGENSTGRVLEIDPAGQAVFALQTSPFEAGQHQNMRMVRKLENGHYLVCHSGARLVKEYTPQGEVAWQVKVSGPLAFAALRTPQGTTLVSSLDQITEFNNAGQSVWTCTTSDIPGVTIHNMTGLHLLANGNLVVGCYRAYNNGEGSALLEITHDKKLVWRYANPRGDGTMMPVELLSPEGNALPGPCRR
jgi:outer membrane protein assembly factor BamB